MKQKFNFAQIHNIESQIKYFKTMGDNLVYSIDVLQAYHVPLYNIMNLYVQFYHGGLIKDIKIFWKENMHLISSMEILEILTWMSDYNTKLESFGVTDDRLKPAMTTLSVVFSKKLLKNSIDLIYNLIEQEKISVIEKDEETDVLVTHAPSDLFKILSESLALIKICKQKDLGVQVLKSCLIYLGVFQNDYITEINDDKFDIDHLYTTCNNIIQYISQSKDFKEAALELIRDATYEEVEEIMPNAMILQLFNQIGNHASKKLCQYIFDGIDSSFVEYFTLTKTTEILKNLWTIYGEKILALQTLYQRKVLKYFVEQVVCGYMRKAMSDSATYQAKMVRLLQRNFIFFFWF